MSKPLIIKGFGFIGELLEAIEIKGVIDNRYEIIELIGSGGLGRVFKAKDLETKEFVALKFLHESLITNERLLGFFHRELLITSSFKHKNIICFKAGHFEPPLCYLVNDYVDGWNGFQFLGKTGKVPPLVALSICVDLLQGLDYLHLHDVIHSDLSISNIMIDKTGRVQLADFGLSFDTAIENYKDKQFGTPGYISPEHISYSKISEQSDLYCVGLIFWQLVTGEKFLTGKKDNKINLQQMKKRDLSKLSDLKDKGLRKGLKSIFKKSLSYHKFFRYKSAQQMLIDCYKLMKENNVDYPRYAIWQYLDDKALASQTFQKEKQNIYGVK